MNFDLMGLRNESRHLRTKLHLHVKHIICVYECVGTAHIEANVTMQVLLLSNGE
jgi:hypothetical protein